MTRRVELALAFGAFALSLGVYLLGDQTDWTQGYGYDGRFYGELATNWPSAVFGHGAIIPPGLGAYHGPHVTGIDSYYVYRLLPSGLVWLMLHATGSASTHDNVVTLFAILDALAFGVATFAWCRSAALLRLGVRPQALGVIALLVNFAVLKTGSYYPVLTDHLALGLGALSMFLWLRGSRVGLAVCVVAACFTWPLHVPIGLLLLLFPPPRDAADRLAMNAGTPRSWRPSRFGLVLGAGVAAVAIGVLAYLQLRGYRSAELTDQLPLVPLSIGLVGVFAFAVTSYLAPPGGLREVWGWIRSTWPGRLLTGVGVIGGTLVAMQLIVDRNGYTGLDLFKDAFWSTTLDPGVFLVVFLCYWGPLMLLLLADLPRVGLDARTLGPGMIGAVAVGLFGALLDQPREVVDAFPFLVLAGVLAARRVFPLTTPAIVGFAAVSVVLSRVWFTIGPLGTDLTRLQEFPAQRYFMATGAWTSPVSYAIQLAAVAATVAALWAITRREPRGRPRAAPGAPARDTSAD